MKGDVETYHEGDQWKNKVEGNSRASSVHDTKKDAQAAGRDMAKSRGVEHVIKKASQMNAVFATVLGLVALLYIATVIAMLGLEVNVVLTKRLYPRALLTPFTDSVVLTEADKRVYTEYAQAQRHKGFEQIQVSFDDQDP